MSREPSLEGAVALVTGAGRGIGAATAIELAGRGARVALAARTDAELLEVAKHASILGGEAFPVQADVTVEAEVERLFREVRERLGPVTHLVNNAGTVLPSPLASMTLEQWRTTLDVNLTSAFLCSRAALADMLPRKRGRIVNVASVSGLTNVARFPGFVAYAAAKAGVLAFTEALAAEVGTTGVRVLAVSPGSVGTRLLARVAPAGTVPDLAPEDVARAIAFLCSPDAAAANGANLTLWGR